MLKDTVPYTIQRIGFTILFVCGIAFIIGYMGLELYGKYLQVEKSGKELEREELKKEKVRIELEKAKLELEYLKRNGIGKVNSEKNSL